MTRDEFRPVIINGSYFRLVDPLCKLIMRLKTRYNPFRDWDRLMQMHRKWVRAGRPRPH
jgi:hypothetical protein